MAKTKKVDESDTVAVTFRLQRHLVVAADLVAQLMSSSDYEATPQDAFRAAIQRGFQQMLKELSAKSGPVFRVQGWDGINTTCLFHIAREKAEAVREAEELAKRHAGGRWTVMKVFEGDKEEPFKRIVVPR